jgi:hypothetical protein
VHHHRDAKARDQFKKTGGLVVIGVSALMAGVDQDAVEAVFANAALQFLQERAPAAGQRAGEDDNAIFVTLLNLGAVLIPTAEKTPATLRRFCL